MEGLFIFCIITRYLVKRAVVNRSMQSVIPGFTPKYFLKNISRNLGPELADWYLVT